MRVLIQPDEQSVSLWAAQFVKDKIVAFAPTRDKPFVLGLPTGSTPLGMYQALIQMYQNGQVSFKNVVTFNMDEYVGLSATHPQSYHYFMWENFFRHIDIRPENTHILDGTAPDLSAECQAFENKITTVGGIHLFIGGVGSDGHIAFNEPFSSLSSRTRIKTLTTETITANARFFDNDMAQVPTQALTVGIGTIMAAQQVMILAMGPGKAKALHDGIEGGISHTCPLSALQMHPSGMIVCDGDAAHQLSPVTKDYFQQIESV